MPIVFASIIDLVFDQHLVATPDYEPIEEVDLEASDVVMDIPLRRLKRACRLAISDDYIVYL